MRRGILFVCYGSEEMGGFGSRYFGEHPPVPLSSIVANLELEMIGSQDPKLPAGHLMMTGFERSNFGDILRRNGALIAPDPYPEEHFFQRSDNYSLALKGIVAHTVSGWAVVADLSPADRHRRQSQHRLMTRAIQSLIAPLRAIANGGETPKWRAGRTADRGIALEASDQPEAMPSHGGIGDDLLPATGLERQDLQLFLVAVD